MGRPRSSKCKETRPEDDTRAASRRWHTTNTIRGGADHDRWCEQGRHRGREPGAGSGPRRSGSNPRVRVRPGRPLRAGAVAGGPHARQGRGTGSFLPVAPLPRSTRWPGRSALLGAWPRRRRSTRSTSGPSTSTPTLWRRGRAGLMSPQRDRQRRYSGHPVGGDGVRAVRSADHQGHAQPVPDRQGGRAAYDQPRIGG
jgi:hypothetical protein